MTARVILRTLAIVLLILFVAYLLPQTVAAITARPVFISELRTVLELASFASTPVLLIAAILGLRQLYFAKSQLDTAKQIFRKQSTRDAFRAAASECRNFADNILPVIAEFDEFLQKNHITVFADAKVTRTQKGLRVVLSKVDREQVKKLSAIDFTITKYMNGMELFALHFASGIADDNIGYLTFGKVFVREAE
jgi:hypothetical protein